MNALQFFHQAHKERIARIEARAYRPKPAGISEPPAAVVPAPAADLSSMFNEAWSLIERADRPQGAPTVVAIQRVVAKHYNVHRMDLISARRTANIVRPRQVAMYLAKTLTLRSLPEIGRRFGGRDHTTALHAIRKIDRLITTDADLAAKVAEIKNEIGGCDATP